MLSATHTIWYEKECMLRLRLLRWSNLVFDVNLTFSIWWWLVWTSLEERLSHDSRSWFQYPSVITHESHHRSCLRYRLRFWFNSWYVIILINLLCCNRKRIWSVWYSKSHRERSHPISGHSSAVWLQSDLSTLCGYRHNESCLWWRVRWET